MKPLATLLAVIATAGLLHAQSPEKGYSSAIKATPLLKTGETAGGQPIVYPQTANPEVTAVLVEIPPGAETGWHRHPFPSYGYILSGNLTVELEGGKTSTYSAGQALVEVVDIMHNGTNTGAEPVKLVMFVTGEKGLPFTVKDTRKP